MSKLERWAVILLCAYAAYNLFAWLNKPVPVADKVTVTPVNNPPVIIEGAKWSPQVSQPPINVIIPNDKDSLYIALINALNRLNAVNDYDSTLTFKSGPDTTGIAKVHIKVTDNALQSFGMNLQTFNKTVEHTIVNKWQLSGGLLMAYKSGILTPYYTVGLSLPKVSYEIGKETSGNGVFVGAKVTIFTKRK